MGKGEMAKIGGEMAKGELGKGEMGINPYNYDNTLDSRFMVVALTVARDYRPQFALLKLRPFFIIMMG
jgi:hypothetical protein